jgi:hypothetical protein
MGITTENIVGITSILLLLMFLNYSTCRLQHILDPPIAAECKIKTCFIVNYVFIPYSLLLPANESVGRMSAVG